MNLPAIRRPLLAVCAAGSIWAHAALAQDPTQRRGIAALRDSLSRVTDTLLLRARQQLLLTQVRSTPQDAFSHLRLGWVEMRLGDLVATRHFDNAATEFQYAADLQATWPLAWYGLGMAELRVGARESLLPLNERARLREDATTRATNALVKAAQLDATLVPAIVHDGFEVADPNEWRARGRVLLDLGRRLSAVSAGRDSALQMARVEVERNFGSRDSVVRLLEGFVSRAPRNAPLLYRLGTARFEANRLDGNTPWYLGLELADANLVSIYRADLAPIANLGELQAFDRAQGAERARVVREAFERRDHRELHAPGERLLEHYARWDFARRELTPPGPGLLRSYVAWPLDARGRLYLRQGPPDERNAGDGLGPPTDESWRYGEGDSAHVFRFVAGPARAGFQLASGAGKRSVAWDAAADRMPLQFTEPLRASTRFLALGGDAGHSQVQLVMGIPLQRLKPPGSAAAPRYQIRIRADILGSNGASLVRIDTVYQVAAGVTGSSGGPLYHRLPIEVPQGSVVALAAVSVDGAGVVAPPETLWVAPAKAGEPALSDLAFGNRGVQLPWVLPGGDTAWVSPGSRFASKVPIQVAFQVTGVPAGTSVSTEIKVLRPRGGFSPLRQILTLFLGGNNTVYREQQSSQSKNGGGWILRDLGAAGLAPGEYTVQVTVTALGVKLTRQRALVVGP